jgi:hypothetical protein
VSSWASSTSGRASIGHLTFCKEFRFSQGIKKSARERAAVILVIEFLRPTLPPVTAAVGSFKTSMVRGAGLRPFGVSQSISGKTLTYQMGFADLKKFSGALAALSHA